VFLAGYEAGFPTRDEQGGLAARESVLWLATHANVSSSFGRIFALVNEEPFT
jgi:hypothetical protein